MSPENSIKVRDPYILVEGPKRCDAEFYGKWLLMAAKAEALWEKALADPDFEKRVFSLVSGEIPDFGRGATVMLSRLEKDFISFKLRVFRNYMSLVEEFVMMAEMGFFVLTGQRYQMTIPAELNAERVKMAALKFAETLDEDFLHPEHLVATMPYPEAKAWQLRLRNMDTAHRDADRLLLLDDANGAA